MHTNINKESLTAWAEFKDRICLRNRGKDVTCAWDLAEETMFTTEASESLRSWIEKISICDFDDIASIYTSGEADCDSPEV